MDKLFPERIPIDIHVKDRIMSVEEHYTEVEFDLEKGIVTLIWTFI